MGRWAKTKLQAQRGYNEMTKHTENTEDRTDVQELQDEVKHV
jgi:hypothetical protein